MNSEDQFEAIVMGHYQALFRFAMSLAREEADALDLTQHTFYAWAKKGHQLRDPSKVRAWLFTTLHHAFLEGRRKQGRFAGVELHEAEEELPVLIPEYVDRLDSSQVLSALGRVDEVFRAPVALFYLEDCSYKTIAGILGVPVGTIKSRISRGIAQLRAILRFDETEATMAVARNGPGASGTGREA